MAQQVWTYIGDEGKQFNVGLYHDPKTAHLLVYVNQSPVIIDFHVRQSRSYPIFLDDEFCELKIESESGQFVYNFEINKEADTPKNRHRKKIAKKHWRQTILVFGGMILIALLFSAMMLFFNRAQKAKQASSLFAHNSLTTIGRVDDIRLRHESFEITFSYVAEGRALKGKMSELKVAQAQTPFGFPIAKHDEFVIQYLPGEPEVCNILLDQPSEKQLEKYKAFTLGKHLLLHPDESEQRATCLIDIAFELKGLQGLADFYNQDISVEQNPVSNTNTYKRLTRDQPFDQAQRTKCL